MHHRRPGPVLSVTGILVALGLGGLVSYLYVPEVRAATDGITAMIGCRVSELTPGVTPYPFEGEAAFTRRHPPEHAEDRDESTYWLSQGERDRWVYTLRFNRKVDLQRLNVYAGAPDEGSRPKTIRLRAGDARLEPAPLVDTAELQSVEACLRGIEALTVIVVDTYPGEIDNVAIRRFEPIALK
jgi:hypothetical protein